MDPFFFFKLNVFQPLKFHEHFSLDHKLASKNVIQGLQLKWNFLQTRKMRFVNAI